MSTDTIPCHLKYTAEHEWIEVQGDTALVGITHYAQESLGDLVYIELPDVGDDIATGDSFTVIESVKAASEVYAPISGEVLEVHKDLEDAPEIINAQPYDAWIVKVKISVPKELEDLMDADTYADFVESLG